jgi:hypothetical protein
MQAARGSGDAELVIQDVEEFVVRRGLEVLVAGRTASGLIAMPDTEEILQSGGDPLSPLDVSPGPGQCCRQPI